MLSTARPHARPRQSESSAPLELSCHRADRAAARRAAPPRRAHEHQDSPHFRCLTSAAVHPGDRAFAAAGDDTRVVLYSDEGPQCPLSLGGKLSV